MSTEDTPPTQTVDQKSVAKDSFFNFINRLGVRNNAETNNLSAGNYEFNLITRNRIKLEAAYRGSWVVGQIVDAYADDMTRAGINITTSKAPQNIKPLQNFLTKTKIWQSTNCLTKWGRMYGGAIAVMQIKGQNPTTPLDLASVGKDQFLGLVVYDRWQLNPSVSIVIEEGPDMGLPMYYDIVNRRDANVGGAPSLNPKPPEADASGQVRVHHSRCIRMIGIELPYFQAVSEMMWGESVIERVWDRLIAFDDTTLSTANLVDKANLRMVAVDGLREIIAQGGKAMAGLIEMFEMVRRMQTNEGITLIDKMDAYSTNNYSFTGLSDVLLQFGQQLSGASGIPLVRLFGQSPAGLSATGEADLRMYYDNINAQQEARLRDPFDTILKVAYQSKFGEPCPDDLEFTFNPLWQMSDLDKATVNKTNAETIIAAFTAGGITRPVMMRELRTVCGDNGLFGNITDADINEAEEDEPPMPDAEGAESLLSPDSPAKLSEAVKNIDAKPSWIKRVFGAKET